MKVILEQKKCIGCGACSALDPKNFKMKDDNSKADLLDSEETDELVFEKDVEYTNDLQDGTDSCPVQCIILKKD